MNNMNSLYQGYVKDNRDPKNLGRVYVQLMGLGSNPKDIGWVNPAAQIMGNLNAGEFKVPSINSIVVVGFIQGKFEEPVYFGSMPRYIEDEKSSSLPDEVKSKFDDNGNRVSKYNPDNWFYKSKKGSKIYVCDDDYNEHIEITDVSGAGIKISSPINKVLRDKYNIPREDTNIDWSDTEIGSSIRLASKDNDSYIELFSAGIGGKSHIKLKADNISLISNNANIKLKADGEIDVAGITQKNNIKNSIETSTGKQSTNCKAEKKIVQGSMETFSDTASTITTNGTRGINAGDINQITDGLHKVKLGVEKFYSLNANNENITIKSELMDTKITLTSNDILIKDVNNNEIKIDSSGIKINSPAQVEVTGSLIKMGSGSEPYIKLSSLLTYLTTLESKLERHTHISNVNGLPTTPSSVSIPPITFIGGVSSANLNSTKILGE